MHPCFREPSRIQSAGSLVGAAICIHVQVWLMLVVNVGVVSGVGVGVTCNSHDVPVHAHLVLVTDIFRAGHGSDTNSTGRVGSC